MHLDRVGPDLLGNGKAGGIAVDVIDPFGAERARQRRGVQADRRRASPTRHDEHGRARLFKKALGDATEGIRQVVADAGRVDRRYARRQFHHHGFGIGNADAIACRAAPVAEYAKSVSRFRRHRGAGRRKAFAATLAPAAGDQECDHDAVAARKRGHFVAGLDHIRDELVTETERVPCRKLTLEVRNISIADGKRDRTHQGIGGLQELWRSRRAPLQPPVGRYH